MQPTKRQGRQAGKCRDHYPSSLGALGVLAVTYSFPALLWHAACFDEAV